MTRELTLHLVTDERVAFDVLRDVVDRAVDGGVSVVQLRNKRTDAADLLSQAIELSRVVAGRAAFVIDDRLDVAIAARDAGAAVDGVHLGQRDVPPTTARRVLGPDAVIGWTANTPAHLAAAAAMPAGTLDYLGVGVIRPTATKPDHPAPLGVDGFARLAAATPLPCIAIGGVEVGDGPALRAAGAAGIAVVTAISGAADPRAAAAALRGAFSDAAVRA